MSRTAISISLTAFEQALLESITRQRNVAAYMKQRVHTVLVASSGLPNQDIAPLVGLSRNAVSKWRTRWAGLHQIWQQSDIALRPKMEARLVFRWLADGKGRGRKNEITLEQRAKIAGLSQETPEQNGLPVTHWTLDLLAETAVKRGIVETVSRVSVHRILKKTTCRPIVVGTG